MPSVRPVIAVRTGSNSADSRNTTVVVVGAAGALAADDAAQRLRA